MGAVVGGKLVKGGRKKVFLDFNAYAVISYIFMQVLDVYVMAAAKFVNAFLVTVVQVAAVMMVNETVPAYLLGACGSVIAIM